MKRYIPELDPETDYIRLSQLPIDEAIGLSKWLKETDYLTANLLSDRVHIDEYEFWFDHCKNDVETEDFALF